MGTRFGAELPGPHPAQEDVDDLRGSSPFRDLGQAALLPVHGSSHECPLEGPLTLQCSVRQADVAVGGNVCPFVLPSLIRLYSLRELPRALGSQPSAFVAS